ncbi:MAG: hypothetical protein LBS31_12525 [Candidatus Adiutrix sp.]|jgi:hypothetical protein|nr:hypothetical protein [Candidatus Adiutrix sp.]
MKLLRIEKIWLIFTVALFVVWNIPGLPPQGDVQGALLWCFGGLIVSWVVHYSVNARIYKIYRPRMSDEDFLAENLEMDRLANEKALAEIEAEKPRKAGR